MMRLTRQQLFKLVSLLLIGVTLVGGMLIFFNLNRAAIHNELVALYLLPKTETLTELYFKDSTNLPKSATSNQAISFAFVIHNLEATDYQYTYDVSVSANSTKHIVDSGTILAKDGQYLIKNERFRLLNMPGSQEVIVELINKHQSIDFRTGE